MILTRLMTDKAPVNNAILRAHYETSSDKDFCHVPFYNWVRSRGFLVKIQDGNKENRVVGKFAALLECTENKLM